MCRIVLWIVAGGAAAVVGVGALAFAILLRALRDGALDG
jgi:hypothetical protein